MTSPNPLNSVAAYLPVDFQLPEDDAKQREMINERERKTASIVNTKEIALYQVAALIPGAGTVENGELLNGQQWFFQQPTNMPRIATYIYRSAFDIVALNGGVALPAGAATTVNHGLSSGGGVFTFTRIFGTTTKAGPVFMPIPYASPTLNLNIEVSVTNSQITVNVGAGQTALTQCYIVLEYFKA
jgi:hypothetical protein